MSRRKKRDFRPLFAISFALGILLGFIMASVWYEPLPRLELSAGESHVRSVTIVGISKKTVNGAMVEEGLLAVVKVEILPGDGDVLINIPPYENEDTQQAAVNAKDAAVALTNINLEAVDLVVSIENVSSTTTVAGPSVGSAVAVLMVAAIRASENVTPNQVRQDAVVSAQIDSIGRLIPVGDIEEKYETVREAGGFSLFVISDDQSFSRTVSPDLELARAGNLEELADLVLW